METKSNSVRFGNVTIPTIESHNPSENERLEIVKQSRANRGSDVSSITSATDLSSLSFVNRMKIGKIYVATGDTDEMQDERKMLRYFLEEGKKVTQNRLYALGAGVAPEGLVTTMPNHDGWLVVSPTIWEILWITDPAKCGIIRCFDFIGTNSEGKEYKAAQVVCLYKGAKLPAIITDDVKARDEFEMPAWCK